MQTAVAILPFENHTISNVTFIYLEEELRIVKCSNFSNVQNFLIVTRDFPRFDITGKRRSRRK